MKRIRRLLGLVTVVVFLVSCTPPLDTGLPTVGPVRAGSGGPGTGSFVFTANTNCVDAGGAVTFTITLANQAMQPFTITSSPVLDIVLESFNPASTTPDLTTHWSATNQYPTTMPLVWMPGESRTYQWRWVADSAFDPPKKIGTFVRAKARFGVIKWQDGGEVPAGDLDLIFGINSLPIDPGRELPCAELPRASATP